MSKKTTKRALAMSFVSVFLCVCMLVGTTFAWFTDSVTSSNNIIKSGTLDVTMGWADGTEDPASVTWTDASTGAIFNYDKWEPGYVEVRHIKIENKGTLALKYQLNIVANGTVSDLANVIDVYFVDPAAQATDRTLVNMTKIGTLTQVLAGMPASTSAEMLSGEVDTVTIALKMQETADNDYQNLSIGSDFAVKLTAAQLAYESDSFNNQYDKNAGYDQGKTNIGPYKLNVLAGGVSSYDTETKTYTNVIDTVAQGGWNVSQGNYYAGYTVNVAGYGEDATVKFNKADGTEVTWKLADEARDGFITNGVHQQWTAVGLSSAYRYDIDGDGVTDFTVVNDASNAKVEVATVDQLKKVIEQEGVSAILIADIDMGTEKLTVAKDVVLDLNGYVLSGTCNGGQGYLIMVNNGATLDIKDSSAAETGKITYAQGTSNTGWAIDLEGQLNLYSGTIELTGDSWDIAYCVDVRPNAWGTNYTENTVFTMYGGKLVSSFDGIRVASSSSDTYSNIVASFVMEGGEVDAARDGIFMQQSNAAYDTLSVEIKEGAVLKGTRPIRVYGPNAISVNAGTTKPMTITADSDSLVLVGALDTSYTWHTEGKIAYKGGMSLDNLNQYSTITLN